MYSSICISFVVISITVLSSWASPVGRFPAIERIDPLEILREGRLCQSNDRNCNPDQDYERDEAYDGGDDVFDPEYDEPEDEEDEIELEPPKYLKNSPPVNSKVQDKSKQSPGNSQLKSKSSQETKTEELNSSSSRKVSSGKKTSQQRHASEEEEEDYGDEQEEEEEPQSSEESSHSSSGRDYSTSVEDY
ncbi:unnamed protein product [Allacma fusca]|uniref:Uncharacterized protein n=1 Tax=Allacma fusca TaxID=39272 RepID=A0A8J2J266_9HEXA|nr:unnamed protein product [Allacma fusca]